MTCYGVFVLGTHPSNTSSKSPCSQDHHSASWSLAESKVSLSTWMGSSIPTKCNWWGEKRRKQPNFKPSPHSHHSGVSFNNDEFVDHILLLSHNNDVSCFDSSPFKRDGGRWQAITQHGHTAMGAGRIIHRNSDSSKSKRWRPMEELWFYFYTSNQLFECIMNAVNTPNGYNKNTLLIDTHY